MKNKTELNNKVCKPSKPKNADAKALRCLKALLAGNIINRKTLGDMGIAANNDSAHSIISTIRHELLVPIVSNRQSDGTCDYYIEPKEITRYNNPELKREQSAEMKLIVESEYQQKLITTMNKFLKRLVEFPLLWGYWEELPYRLADMAREINALLSGEKSVNQKQQ